MRALGMRVIINWPQVLSSNHKFLNQLGTATGVQAQTEKRQRRERK
jgi:hypothetical protein